MCSSLSQEADNPCLLVSATVPFNSAYWKRDAWLNKTMDPLPSTPSRGDEVSGVGTEPSDVVTNFKSKKYVSGH